MLVVVRALLRPWIVWLSLERSASPHTIAAYRRDVERFVEFGRVADISSPSHLTADHIRQHLRGLSESLGARSVARHLWSIRSFLDFLRETGRMDRDLGDLIELPRLPKPLPKVVSADDVAAMIDAAANRETTQYGEARPTRLTLRDAAILETLFATGARQAELARMRLDDVDLGNGWIRVFGKGSRERMVPLGSKARAAIEQYIKHGRPQIQDATGSQALFLSRSGQPMDPSAVYRLVQRAAVAAGLSGNVGPHRLRHAFATALLDNGCNLRVVQELLCFKAAATTEIYTHVSVGRLSAVHAACHPLGRNRIAPRSTRRGRRRSRRNG